MKSLTIDLMLYCFVLIYHSIGGHFSQRSIKFISRERRQSYGGYTPQAPYAPANPYSQSYGGYQAKGGPEQVLYVNVPPPSPPSNPYPQTLPSPVYVSPSSSNGYGYMPPQMYGYHPYDYPDEKEELVPILVRIPKLYMFPEPFPISMSSPPPVNISIPMPATG